MLTVLYRTTHRGEPRWLVYDEQVSFSELGDVVRHCKAATASPWIWWGPEVIARWMTKNPNASVEGLSPPQTLLRKARADLRKQVDKLKAGVTEATTMLEGFEPKKGTRNGKTVVPVRSRKTRGRRAS